MRRHIIAIMTAAAVGIAGAGTAPAQAQSSQSSTVSISELPDWATIGSSAARQMSSDDATSSDRLEGSSDMTRDYVIGSVAVTVIGAIIYQISKIWPRDLRIPLSS